MSWIEDQLSEPYGYLKYQLVYLALMCLFAACALLYVKWLVKRDTQTERLRLKDLQTIKTPAGETLVVLPLQQYDALVNAADPYNSDEG